MNNYANALNFSSQNQIPGKATIYNSINTVINPDEVVNYPKKFLNLLDLPGMRLHMLALKIDAPIILKRNINPL